MSHELRSPDDGRNWARKIIARRDLGEKLNPTVLRFASEALGLPVSKGWR